MRFRQIASVFSLIFAIFFTSGLIYSSVSGSNSQPIHSKSAGIEIVNGNENKSRCPYLEKNSCDYLQKADKSNCPAFKRSNKSNQSQAVKVTML